MNLKHNLDLEDYLIKKKRLEEEQENINYQKINSKIDILGQEIKGDIQRLDNRIDKLDNKIDMMGQEIKGDIQRLDNRIDKLDNKIENVKVEIQRDMLVFKTDIQKELSEQNKWTIGLVVIMILGFLGIILSMIFV